MTTKLYLLTSNTNISIYLISRNYSTFHYLPLYNLNLTSIAELAKARSLAVKKKCLSRGSVGPDRPYFSIIVDAFTPLK